jgi:hypothetical protein
MFCFQKVANISRKKKNNIFFTKTNLGKNLFYKQKKLENIFSEKTIWKYFFPCFLEGKITKEFRVSYEIF